MNIEIIDYQKEAAAKTKNEQLQNENIRIEFRPARKEIFAQDLTDLNNLPAFYTTTGKRYIPKAWRYLQQNWSQEFTLWDIQKILGAFKVNTHYWCMMD